MTNDWINAQAFRQPSISKIKKAGADQLTHGCQDQWLSQHSNHLLFLVIQLQRQKEAGFTPKPRDTPQNLSSYYNCLQWRALHLQFTHKSQENNRKFHISCKPLWFPLSAGVAETHMSLKAWLFLSCVHFCKIRTRLRMHSAWWSKWLNHKLIAPPKLAKQTRDLQKVKLYMYKNWRWGYY